MVFQKNNTAKAKPLPPGVYTPAITIYQDTPEQAVDHEAQYKHFQYIASSGMHGIVALGTNGEMAMLNHQERAEVIRTARRAVVDLGIPEYPIVAGIAAQSTSETVQFAKEAAEAGAGWGLLLPPSYWTKAVSADVVAAFYTEVADQSPIPIVIYNYPGVVSGVDVDSDTILQLAEHPNIVAVKLTCGQVGKAIRVTAHHGQQSMAVYGGSADYLLPGLLSGSSGCVVGMGNVFPKAVAHLYELWAAGKPDEANALQEKVSVAEWACKKSLNITKYAAWYHIGRQTDAGKEGGYVMRKPYLPLKDSLKQWGLETLSVLEEVEKSLPGRQIGH